MKRIEASGLKIAPVLYDFIAKEATPDTGIAPDAFWAGLAAIVADLAPHNRELLAVRDALQAKIDAWHKANKGKPFDMAAYTACSRRSATCCRSRPQAGRDRERGRGAPTMFGPQLVVPLTNARYALNAPRPWAACTTLLRHRRIPHEAGEARAPTRARGDMVSPRPSLPRPGRAARHGNHSDVTAYSIEHGQLDAKLKAATPPR